MLNLATMTHSFATPTGLRVYVLSGEQAALAGQAPISQPHSVMGKHCAELGSWLAANKCFTS